MDAEKIYSLLFGLYAEQENLKIEYELDSSFFSTDGFNRKHFYCQGKVSLSSDTAHPFQIQEVHETRIQCVP